MTAPLTRPKRKNPLKKTRQPLYPQSIRSRTAQGLTAAAAQGRFELQCCADCKAVFYPPRDACPKCLSARVPFVPVDNRGTVLAETTIRTSTDPYFRERTPWRVGLDQARRAARSCCRICMATCARAQRVRLDLKLDKGGAPVLIALPEKDTPNMADDPQLREMTCDPKFRRVLITDGRTAVGQAMAKAFSEAGANDRLRRHRRSVEAVPGRGGAAQDRARRDRAARRHRHANRSPSRPSRTAAASTSSSTPPSTCAPGGIMQRHGLTIAREEMDVRYFGLMRLAQAFGPAMRSRGADGVNSAAAFVNLLSVHALMNWPAYGAYSAAEAACLSAAQCLRAELRPGGVKVLNVFFGPLETEWFQTVPPPKVAPSALAKAVVQALQRGLEDVFVGDIAEDIRARLAVNPKALEREMAG